MTNPMIDYISDDDIESLDFAIDDAISEYAHDKLDFDENDDNAPERILREHRTIAIAAILEKLQFTPTFEQLLEFLANMNSIPLDAREQLDNCIRNNFNE